MDWGTSTKTESICWIVASASGWYAVRSAPSVTLDRPMRPAMGATIRQYPRLISPAATAARQPWTSASTCFSAASASSTSCSLTALSGSRARTRSVRSRIAGSCASALARVARALSSEAR